MNFASFGFFDNVLKFLRPSSSTRRRAVAPAEQSIDSLSSMSSTSLSVSSHLSSDSHRHFLVTTPLNRFSDGVTNSSCAPVEEDSEMKSLHPFLGGTSYTDSPQIEQTDSPQVQQPSSSDFSIITDDLLSFVENPTGQMLVSSSASWMRPEFYTPKHLPPPGAMGEWEVPSLICFDNNMHKSTMANRELAILEEDHQEKALRINGDDSDSSGSASTELSSMFSWRHDEFERAASLRVHCLFDELEEQLFEGKAGSLSDELRKECMQWTDHFPHLRIRGQQLAKKSSDNLKSFPSPPVVSAMTVSPSEPSEPSEQSDTYQWQDSEHVTAGIEAADNSHPDGNPIPNSQTAHIQQQVIDILFDELWQGLLDVRGGLGETLGVFMKVFMTEAHGTEFGLEQRNRPQGEQPPMKNLSPQSLCFSDVQSHHSQAIRPARDIQNYLKELVLVQAKPLQQRPRTMRTGRKDLGKFSPPKKPLLLPPINSDSNDQPLPLTLMHQNQVHQASLKEPSTRHDTVGSC